MIKDYRQFELYGKSIFEKAIIAPPFRMEVNMQNDACFYYIIRGNSRVVTYNDIIDSNAEEGMVLKCGKYINEYLCKTEPSNEPAEALAVHFYPDVLKKIYTKEIPEFLKDIRNTTPVSTRKLKHSQLLKAYIQSLQFYFENEELVTEELLQLKLKEIILLLVKLDPSQKMKALLANMFTPDEIDFKELIEAHVFSNLSVEELARLSHMSVSSFKRNFQKHYKDSPAKYIRNRKLSRAAKLLASSDLRITEIALECGFSDLAHFSKSFLKKYNQTPSNYKLTQKHQSLN